MKPRKYENKKVNNALANVELTDELPSEVHPDTGMVWRGN
jgi:hypothetical protein